MITRTTHLRIQLLTFGITLALAGLPGCDRQESSKDGEGHGGHAKADPGPVLMVMTEPAVIKAGEPVKYTLMIHDATGAMIKDFETVHEKKLHLIIVRDALDRFAHVHPEIDRAGSITGAFTFPTAGKYLLYADHKPTGKKQAAPIAEVTVDGTPPPRPELVPSTPGRVKAGELVADIAAEKTRAEGTTRISFALFDAAAKPIADLQPYLGAMGHLVLISADGKQYVHSHPSEEKSSGGPVAFEAHFPGSGIYKGWGQFRRSGTVHDVPFVVRIE